MGHGQIEAGDQNEFMGDNTGREKHVGKLQPLNHMKTPKIDERHQSNRRQAFNDLTESEQIEGEDLFKIPISQNDAFVELATV